MSKQPKDLDLFKFILLITMKCDIHCATKILTLVCGGLIVALAISRFTNLSIEHP